MPYYPYRTLFRETDAKAKYVSPVPIIYAGSQQNVVGPVYNEFTFNVKLGLPYELQTIVFPDNITGPATVFAQGAFGGIGSSGQLYAGGGIISGTWDVNAIDEYSIFIGQSGYAGQTQYASNGGNAGGGQSVMVWNNNIASDYEFIAGGGGGAGLYAAGGVGGGPPHGTGDGGGDKNSGGTAGDSQGNGGSGGSGDLGGFDGSYGGDWQSVRPSPTWFCGYGGESAKPNGGGGGDGYGGGGGGGSSITLGGGGGGGSNYITPGQTNLVSNEGLYGLGGKDGILVVSYYTM